MPFGPRGVLAVAIASVLCLPASACTYPDQRRTETVTLALSGLRNPFFREMRSGAWEAADAAGVRLHVVDARDRAGRQARQLDRAAERGVQAVVVNAVDPRAARSGIDPVLRADVPVVAVDRHLDERGVVSTVTSDNVDGGRQAADAVAAAVEGSGDVVHLRGDPATSVSRERGRGFAVGIRQDPDLHVVATAVADFSRARARRVTTRLLKAHPNVRAVFAENDEMALGVVDALGDRAGDDVAVVGYDGIPQALAAVRSGTMAATVAQAPEQLGRVAVEQAVSAMDGASVAPWVPVGVELVTADNIGMYVH